MPTWKCCTDASRQMKKGSCGAILLYVSPKAAIFVSYSVSLLIQTAKLPICKPKSLWISLHMP